MTLRLGLFGSAILALVACDQPRGIGFENGGSGANVPAGPEVTVFELPGVRPIPSYVATGVSGPEGAVAFGGSRLAAPEANLELSLEGREFLLRQVQVGDLLYVVVQGAAPTGSIQSEIRTRTGCLLDGLPTTVNGVPTARVATVYTLDCS